MRLTILFVALVALLSACQSHYGTYSTPVDYTAWGMTLRKDGTFSYGTSSCTWAQKGIGNYQLRGDTLRLQFEDFKDVVRGNIDLRQINSHQDSIIIHAVVLDSLTLEAVPYGSIAFSREAKLISGTETNFEGEALLPFSLAMAPLTFEVSYLGYSNLSFTIEEPGVYQVRIYMAGSSRVKPMSAQERIYRIVSWKKDSLVLSWFPEDEYDIPLPTTFYRYQPK